MPRIDAQSDDVEDGTPSSIDWEGGLSHTQPVKSSVTILVLNSEHEGDQQQRGQLSPNDADL